LQLSRSCWHSALKMASSCDAQTGSPSTAIGATFAGNVTRFVIQSSWDEPEDEELHEFVRGTGLPVQLAEEDELLAMTPADSTMIFADTSIIQQIVDPSVVPDTYPDCFQQLYGRKIVKEILVAASSSPPFFVKPAAGHKAFDARLVRTLEEAQRVALKAKESEVYICEAVQFVSEHRVFLSPGRIWGVREYSDEVLGGESIVAGNAPPQDFLDQVMACNSLGFVVVDVGLTSLGKWCVVEVNPPFSLSSYGLDIEIYMEYCCAAWSYVLAMQSAKEAGGL